MSTEKAWSHEFNRHENLFSTEAGQNQNMKKFISSNDICLLGLFIALSLTALAKTVFNPDGFISADGGNYLRLAHNLLEGEGFSIQGHRFTHWGVGYPIVIATISYLTNISVFWASKVANILALALSFVMLRQLFGVRSFLYALVFGTAPMVALLSFTLTEMLFMGLALLFSWCCYKYVLIDKKRWAMAATVVSLLLFFTRYIGGFSVGVLLVLSIWCLMQGRRRGFLLLLFCAFMVSVLAWAYLHSATADQGQLTVLTRTDPFKDGTEMAFGSIIGWLSMLNLIAENPYAPHVFFPASFVQFTWLAWVCWFCRRGVNQIQHPSDELEKCGIIIITGLSYLAAILAVWIFVVRFDVLYYRFYAPGTMMLMIGGMAALINKYPVSEQIVKRFLVGCVFASLLLNGVAEIANQQYRLNKMTYSDNINRIRAHYDLVPQGSVVVFDGVHVKYLRPDLIRDQPHTRTETLREFMSRITREYPGREVYFEIQESRHLANIYRDLYHPSIRKFAEKNETSYLVKCSTNFPDAGEP